MKVRLLGLDIDGCLIEPKSRYFSIEILKELRSLNRTALNPPNIIQVFFVSGRPHGFIEAIMRICECRIPSVFENGAGLIMPEDFRIESCVDYSITPTDNLETLLINCRKWVEDNGFGRTVPGKVLTLSFYPLSNFTTSQLAARIRAQFADMEKNVNMFVGPTSVDLVPPGINKSVGVRRIAELLQTPLSSIGGIGDALNDLEWLEIVGNRGAPSNAHPDVKRIADTVASGAYFKGVAEILNRWFS